MNGKYVVFKSEDLDRLLLAFKDKLTPEVGEALNNLVGSALPDAVVIRRQDVFAPPALDAYANSIMAALEIVNTLGNGVPVGLRDIADYFHEQAALSWQADRKIPD